MLRTRVVTAVILVVCLLAALFMLPGLWWSFLVLAATLVAAREWGRLWSFAPVQEYAYLASIAAIAAMAMFVLPPRALAIPLYACAGLFWFVVAPLWLRFAWKPVAKAIGVTAGWLVLISFWLAMVELRELDPWWLLAAMALVWVADIAAYFAGRAFGRHKLAPSISPGKTWEGVAGGMIGVLLYAVLAVTLWHQFEHGLPEFDAYNWAVWLGLAMVMAGISVIGDLFESALKRRAGVKDSGSLLPGHGGLLDRIDALLPVLPLAALIFV